MQSNAAVLGDGQPGDKGPEGFLRARSCWGTVARQAKKNPATRNRTRDHLIAAAFYSQMLYQLSYSRLVIGVCGGHGLTSAAPAYRDCGALAQGSDHESGSPSTSTSGGLPKCRDPGSNRGPSDLQSDALPAELSRRVGTDVVWASRLTPGPVGKPRE